MSFNTQFSVGGSVYMVSEPGKEGWVPGKVYRGIVEANDGTNVTARFPDGSVVTQTVAKLQNQTLNFYGNVVNNLSYDNLRNAFNTQPSEDKSMEWYIQNLKNSKTSSYNQSAAEINEIFGKPLGGRRSNRKSSRKKRKSRRYKK